MVGGLKKENKSLRIRWYLSDSLYTTGLPPSLCLIFALNRFKWAVPWYAIRLFSLLCFACHT